MLNQAKIKRNKFGLNSRWEIIRGDIQNMKEINSDGFDFVFNTYNVLGFVENSELALDEMYRILKKEGLLISFVPNLYHAIFFNIFINRIEEAKKIKEQKRGKFTDNMPNIHFFTEEIISTLYKSRNMNVEDITGFPITIYPGIQETQITGSTENLKEILSLKQNFENIYEIEKYFLFKGNHAARGNNIFIVGKK
jgi:ubiquinone/menaquinone biosynthesis C-methylase UbiE